MEIVYNLILTLYCPPKDKQMDNFIQVWIGTYIKNDNMIVVSVAFKKLNVEKELGERLVLYYMKHYQMNASRQLQKNIVV